MTRQVMDTDIAAGFAEHQLIACSGALLTFERLPALRAPGR